MRDYAKFAPQFWIGETGRQIKALGCEAQVVAIYLFTCPLSNMIGLYYISLPTISHETGIPIEGASKALRSLAEIGFAHFDASAELIWVPEMAGYQIDEQLKPKDKRIKGVMREARIYHKHPFFNEFIAKYRKSFSLNSELLKDEGKPSPLEGASKALRSQEHEQEQEQEQEGRGGASLEKSAADEPDEPRDPMTELEGWETNGLGKLSTPDVCRAVADWFFHLRAMDDPKAVPSPGSWAKKRVELQKLGPAGAVEAIRRSIANNWRSIHPAGGGRDSPAVVERKPDVPGEVRIFGEP